MPTPRVKMKVSRVLEEEMKEKFNYIFLSVVSLLGSFGLLRGYIDFHDLSERSWLVFDLTSV